MKRYTILFALIFMTYGTAYAASSCSKANLTRCLDSACAINISSNPAARCQYCGSSGAGTPPSEKGMRSVSVGASAKYNISEKDLKKAPTDPGERYAWATTQCLTKVSGCTPDDVSETYDSLIEQSCKAAGISAQMKSLATAAKKTKNQSTCQAEIQACLIADKKCTADYRACKADADFDKYFSACSVEATGCDEHISGIRSELLATRNDMVKNAGTALAKIVDAYKAARDKKLSDARASCKDNNSRDACVEQVCATNMPNKCGTGYQSEKTAAIQLCKFYEIACSTLK